MISTTVMVLIFLGLFLIALLFLYRRGVLGSRFSSSQNKTLTLRCRNSDTVVPLEKIYWRCSGEHLGRSLDSKGCPNFTNSFTFGDMQKGYYTSSQGNDAEITVFLQSKPNLPQLVPSNKEKILRELSKTRCYLCGRLMLPYCRCTGNEKEHRIYFDLDLSAVICLTGPVSSGKTVYLHLLDHYFQIKYAAKYRIPYRLGREEASQVIRDGLDKMERDKILMHPTSNEEYDGGLEIRYTIGPSRSNWPSEAINLFFYDTGGEVLDELKRMYRFFGYFLFSKNLVLLIDPFSIPDLGRKCNSFSEDELEKPVTPLKLLTMLERLIEFLRDRIYPNVKVLPMNLALTITKCDEYMHLFDSKLQQLLNTVHLSEGTKPNLDHLDEISEEFKNWFFKYADAKVVSFLTEAEGNFNKVGYFPISSLGTRAYYEEQEVETSGYTGGDGGFATPGRSLEDLPEQVSSRIEQAQQQPNAQKKAITIIRKYEGELNPLYLDYPILWLYKHMR